MTRLEIQARILRALNDSPTAPVYWSASEVQAYIDEGQEVLAEEAPFVSRTFLVPRRPGTVVYQLAGIGGAIMAPTRVWLPDLHRRLEAKSLADLDARHERWLEITGEPWWWVAVNWDAFLIWPFPAAGEGWMEVHCACWPGALIDDGDEPELPASSHEALVTYGEALGHLKQWDAEGTVRAWQAFFGGAGHVRAQAGVNQVQERFFARETRRGEARADREGA